MADLEMFQMVQSKLASAFDSTLTFFAHNGKCLPAVAV